MEQVAQSLLTQGRTIREAIEVIDRSSRQVALVVSPEGRLVGTITDGDVRRGLLRGLSLNDRAEEVMCRDFATLNVQSTRDDALAVMQRESVHQVPVVDSLGHPVDLYVFDEITLPRSVANAVVLMAGGEGKRLRPATNTTPKPMLPVGGRPILEIILEGCIRSGFSEIFIAVNYMSDKIMQHFGDGSQWNAQISYLQEDTNLGTAGALGLLPEDVREPFVVLNGDVLTRVDLPALMRFHVETAAAITVGVRDHEIHIPFGVAHIEGDRLLSLDEKPVLRHQVSAGVYVVEPRLLRTLQPVHKIDMPEFISSTHEKGETLSAFPIHEYWLDIGNPSSLERARGEWI